MVDLAVKLFMADRQIDDIDIAKAMMFNYGLAQPYEELAERLQPLIETDGDDAYDTGFEHGMDWLHDMVSAMRFDESLATSQEKVDGVELAMYAVHEVMHKCMEGHAMTEEQVEAAAKQVMPEISPDKVAEMFAAYFANGRVPTAR